MSCKKLYDIKCIILALGDILGAGVFRSRSCDSY